MPRKGSKKKISAAEEAANAQALDKAAGVTAPEVKVEFNRENFGPPQTPPLTYDTREKLLLKYASEQWVDGFFADFTDNAELSKLTCRLGMRVLASIICSKDPEFADTKDKIAAMRVMLNIEYGESASMNPEKFIAPPPVATIPVGGTDGIDATMEKMKKFAGGNQ